MHGASCLIIQLSDSVASQQNDIKKGLIHNTYVYGIQVAARLDLQIRMSE